MVLTSKQRDERLSSPIFSEIIEEMKCKGASLSEVLDHVDRQIGYDKKVRSAITKAYNETKSCR